MYFFLNGFPIGTKNEVRSIYINKSNIMYGLNSKTKQIWSCIYFLYQIFHGQNMMPLKTMNFIKKLFPHLTSMNLRKLHYLKGWRANYLLKISLYRKMKHNAMSKLSWIDKKGSDNNISFETMKHKSSINSGGRKGFWVLHEIGFNK